MQITELYAVWLATCSVRRCHWFTVQAANYAPYVRNDHSSSDKLWFAASRGHVDYLRQLLATGNELCESDAVSYINYSACLLIIALYPRPPPPQFFFVPKTTQCLI